MRRIADTVRFQAQLLLIRSIFQDTRAESRGTELNPIDGWNRMTAERGAVRTVVHHNKKFNVDLVLEPRHPILDSTFGLKVDAPEGERHYSRRLVTLGDSLTQGFHHLAIHDTHISWPVMVAERLGLRPGVDFTFPEYAFPGGYPFNLEDALRLISPQALTSVEDLLRYAETVKKDYAPNFLPDLPTNATAALDNLAVWGWDVRDLLKRTAQTELDAFKTGWFRRIFRRIEDRVLPTVDHGENRSGIGVLSEFSNPPALDSSGNPKPDLDLTALQLAERRGKTEDGIETLIIFIGANNVLGIVQKLKIIPSGRFYRNLTKKSRYNVWKPKHFEAELKLLETRVRKIRADHVIWATVPHVTIPPITNGVANKAGVERIDDNPRYFQYYAHPWQTAESLDPEHEARLLGEEAWTIDSVIDAYNDSIVDMVKRERSGPDKRDWRVVDMCAVLDRLAVRRNGVQGGVAYPYLPPYPLPAPLQQYNSRFLDIDPAGNVVKGGIIGLDGVHPTTAGYSLIAHEFMKEMHKAGVVFPTGPTDSAGAPEPDWAGVLAQDTLLNDPPIYIGEILGLIRKLQEGWDFISHGKWL
jgi:hypothetical protein